MVDIHSSFYDIACSCFLLQWPLVGTSVCINENKEGRTEVGEIEREGETEWENRVRLDRERERERERKRKRDRALSSCNFLVRRIRAMLFIFTSKIFSFVQLVLYIFSIFTNRR
jgi:hypothetical protein